MPSLPCSCPKSIIYHRMHPCFAQFPFRLSVCFIHPRPLKTCIPYRSFVHAITPIQSSCSCSLSKLRTIRVPAPNNLDMYQYQNPIAPALDLATNSVCYCIICKLAIQYFFLLCALSSHVHVSQA